MKEDRAGTPAKIEEIEQRNAELEPEIAARPGSLPDRGRRVRGRRRSRHRGRRGCEVSKTRDKTSETGDKSAAAGKAPTPAATRASAAAFQNLAASAEFTFVELREAVDGLD